MNEIDVVVVDDDYYFRQGLRATLEAPGAPLIRPIGVTGDATEALKLVENHAPDVLLADLKLKMGDQGFDVGLDLIRRARRISPETKVLAITAYEQPDLQLLAVQAGVRGYIIKGDQIEGARIREAIATVASGELFYSPHAMRRLHELVEHGLEAEPLEPLTRREQDVLRLLAEGYSNKEIAQTLVIAEKTVKTHVSNILSKFQLKSRYQAALMYRITPQ